MMKAFILSCVKYSLLLAVLLAFFTTDAQSFPETPIHHDLRIELEPSSKFAHIQDKIQFKASPENCDNFAFYLHSDLKLTHHQVPTGWQLHTANHESDNLRLIKVEIIKIRSTPCPEIFSLTLDYSGTPFDPDSNDTTGFIFTGGSYFYPQQINKISLVTFDMQVSLPEPWKAVSQGLRSGDDISGERRVVTWKSTRPSEEIYLIANRYHVYETDHNRLPLFAFLLQKEDELAEQYLETAKGYIDFYSSLIGSYPYEKFALVENSRQTGYGMPSFTLMGSRIIRFPFILHSSYPHEILHNWWGNGVFPDMKQGNWSEGLTAYLADHLLLELKGKGSPYRFQEMMKFSNYINKDNDFPLSEFGYRDSMASQAIGYAKLMMVFHMLRTEIGNEKFLKSLKRFYAKYKYRYAGYADMRRIFEEVSGQNLAGFFQQWLNRKGAPKIRLEKSSYVSLEGRYDLRLTVAQNSPVFKIKLPIAIWTTGSQTAEIHNIELETNRQEFHFQLAEEPVAVRLDPYNDVFRLPGDGEAPVSLAQTYGAQMATALFTENENPGYLKFAQSVAEPENIFTSTESISSPAGSVWVFGLNHPLRKTLASQLQKLNIAVNEKGVIFKDQSYPWKNHSFIFTLNRTDQKKGTITWVITDNEESIPGLMRKLPHYGKYGYLVFEGSTPDNQKKGIWPSNPADLEKIFRNGLSRLLPEQNPLASFKPFH
jgi:aminopeptidase N